jgi:cell division transport system permease protein
MNLNEDKYNEKRYRTAYRTTVFSVTAVLFLLGLTTFIIFHAGTFSTYMRESIAVTVELDEKTPEAAIMALRENILNHRAVRAVNYISPEEATEVLRKELGDDFIDFVGQHPIPPTLEVFLYEAYTFSQNFEAVEKFLLSGSNTTAVYYEKELLDKVNQNISRIATGIFIFSFLLIVVSVLLINNTIRLAVYSKRQLIKSMYLVGATRGFIRRPFLIAGLQQGFVAGIIAGILLLVIIVLSAQKLPGLALLDNPAATVFILAGIVLFGIGMAWISNFIAVKKYLG